MAKRDHSLSVRRYVASMVHKQTGSLKLAQQQLGHSTLSTTANIYTSVDEERWLKQPKRSAKLSEVCGRNPLRADVLQRRSTFDGLVRGDATRRFYTPWRAVEAVVPNLSSRIRRRSRRSFASRTSCHSRLGDLSCLASKLETRVHFYSADK